MTSKIPNSRRNLDLAIQRKFGGEYLRIRTLMANALVAQMLPSGAVKGGSAIKLRFGDVETRFSDDLDTVQGKNLQTFIRLLEIELTKGWNGFTGHIISKPPAKPEGIPSEYVMQPFEVKLSYNEKSWLTVKLEVGHNEIGDADNPDWNISPNVTDIFEQLGFPSPGPVPLMPLHHQIAQKLHGASKPKSNRAHDLIDLQLITAKEPVDYLKTKKTCQELFKYRQGQAWPPAIVKNAGWDKLYVNESESLPVLKSADDAVTWANKLIHTIENSEQA